MIEPQVLEGTWEEILAHNSAQLAGRRVKVYIETSEADSVEATMRLSPPNEQALAMLRELVELQKGMQEADGSQT